MWIPGLWPSGPFSTKRRRFAVRALARGSEFQPAGGELRIIELGWRGTSTLIVGGVAEHLGRRAGRHGRAIGAGGPTRSATADCCAGRDAVSARGHPAGVVGWRGRACAGIRPFRRTVTRAAGAGRGGGWRRLATRIRPGAGTAGENSRRWTSCTRGAMKQQSRTVPRRRQNGPR